MPGFRLRFPSSGELVSERPTLLVAINLASDPEAVCLQAAGLARRMGARVVLLHAAQLPVGLAADAPVRPPGASEPVSAAEMLHQDALRHLDPLLDLMRMHGADVELDLRRGRVVDQVVAAAAALDPLMLIVGSDLPSGLRRLFLGSVTEDLIHAVDVPVLVVKGDPNAAGVLSTGQMQAAAENDG